MGKDSLQSVILCGGLGTRLRPLTNQLPKPMIPVRGKPFLEYEIKMLKKSGVRDFVLCVGFLSEKIMNYFHDGSSLGVRIRYSDEGKVWLGPAGAIRRAAPLLNDDFFVTYGDAYLRLDYGLAHSRFHSLDKLGMMVVNENHNRFGKSDLVVENGMVTRYDKHSQGPHMYWINFGIVFLRKDVLQLIPPEKVVGEEEFYGKLIESRELAAYETRNRFYEIGNPDSLEEFEAFVASSMDSGE